MMIRRGDTLERLMSMLHSHGDYKVFVTALASQSRQATEQAQLPCLPLRV